MGPAKCPGTSYSFPVFSVSASGPGPWRELLVNMSQMCGVRWSQDGKMTAFWNNNAISSEKPSPLGRHHLVLAVKRPEELSLPSLRPEPLRVGGALSTLCSRGASGVLWSLLRLSRKGLGITPVHPSYNQRCASALICLLYIWGLSKGRLYVEL